jgi:hypothetical protein
MRRIILFLALLVIGGCASIPQERYDRIAKRLQFWKSSGESPADANLPDEIQERSTVDEFNSWVGNNSAEFPRGSWSK